MARYEITSPDGKRFEITAPDGASQEQILAYAQQQFAQPKRDIASEIANDPISQGARAELDPRAAMRRDFMVPMGREGKGPSELFSEAVNRETGKLTDFASGLGAPTHVAAGLGYGTNALLNLAPMIIGGEAAKSVSPALDWMGKKLMLNALNPTTRDMLLGKGERAAKTMLDEGVNVSEGGVRRLQGTGSRLNAEVDAKIGASTARIDPSAVAARLRDTETKFASQVDPSADLNAIGNVRAGFENHPFFRTLKDKEEALRQSVASREAAKVSALQDAGRYQTMAAQQGNLANGGGIKKAPNQPVNEPYINVGAADTTLSPSAYPAPGYPRVPGRYTPNAQRVPEAQSAADDAMQIFKQRQIEEAAAKKALDDYVASGGNNMPVKMAQQLKQGTYAQLRDKYGEMGTASTEAQKALARGLREEIETAVPGVASANAKASDIWNALSVAERGAATGAKGPQNSLAFISANPKAAAYYEMSKSKLLKSAIARALYSGQEQIPANIARIGIGAATYGDEQ